MTTPTLTVHPHPVRQVLILSLAPAIGMGFGRFAYALVLPDMRESLAWTYATAGFMNTANSAGYFAGAIGAAIFARYVGLYRSVLIGTILCVISLMICATSGHVVVFSIARLMGGIGAALAFVSGAALASGIAQANLPRSGLLLGLYNSGPGTGVVMSGLTLPFLLQGFGAGSWWIAWAALAVLSVAMTMVLLFAPRDATPATQDAVTTKAAIRPMIPFLAAYGMFGAGYIAYMTFMLAYVRDAGANASIQSVFWCLIGLGAWASPWLWRPLMARGQSGRTMAILLAILLMAVVFARFGQSPIWLAASALMFGSASIGIGTSTLAFARFNYPAAAWPRVIGILTICFSFGQTTGPFITGLITDAMGSLTYALNVSVVALMIAIICAMLQKPLPRSAVIHETLP